MRVTELKTVSRSETGLSVACNSALRVNKTQWNESSASENRQNICHKVAQKR